MAKTQIASYKYQDDRKRFLLQIRGMIGVKNGVLVKDFVENTCQVNLRTLRKTNYLEYVTVLSRIHSWTKAFQNKNNVTINYERTDLGKAMYIVSNSYELKNYTARQDKRKEQFLLNHKRKVKRAEDSIKKKSYLKLKKLQLKTPERRLK